MDDHQDPRIGLTARRNARSPLKTRIAAASFGALGALGLGDALARGLGRARRLWAPSWRTRAFAGYTPTSHDVLVCTYAKSGTNLLLQMVHQIANLGAGDFEHIHDVAPWPDAPHPNGATLDDGGWARAPTGLRAIKTHLDAEHVPYSADARYIVVVRDPRDVVASAYHFAASVVHTLIDVRFEADEWIEMVLEDRLVFGSWAAHTASWWGLRRRPNVLLVTFAEVTRDLEGAVRRVAEFLGVRLDDEARARVVERCSFPWMKAHDAAFRPPVPPLPGRSPAVMVRAGRVGDGARFVDAETRARLDAFFAGELRRLGCDLPYERLIAGEPLEPGLA
ncbi:MAG: sulfotransferase domain-containing protein [Myxococcales bacterium]|nr:sulfotransferase domain-containing protein [Myxococcales bacterium]